jgi:hypothetical protein
MNLLPLSSGQVCITSGLTSGLTSQCRQNAGASERSVQFQTTRRHAPQDINHYHQKMWRIFLHCFTVRMEALPTFETSENTQTTIMGDVTSQMTTFSHNVVRSSYHSHTRSLRSLTHSDHTLRSLNQITHSLTEITHSDHTHSDHLLIRITHSLRSHTHSDHSHTLSNHLITEITHSLTQITHTLTHSLRSLTHSLIQITHTLIQITHKLTQITHTLTQITHSFRSHTHSHTHTVSHQLKPTHITTACNTTLHNTKLFHISSHTATYLICRTMPAGQLKTHTT